MGSSSLGGATCNCQRIDEFQTPATAVPAASCAGVKRPFMTTSAQVVLSSSAVPLDSVIEHDVTRPLASMSTANPVPPSPPEALAAGGSASAGHKSAGRSED